MLSRTELYKTLSDQQLIAKFLEKGDQEVLGVLFKRYMHLIFGVALKYLRNKEDAEDLTLKVYEKLMEELPKRQIRNFSAWLYVLARNECLMHMRNKAYSNEDQFFRIGETEFVENEEPLHHMREEKLRILEKCIEQLKAEQKKCVDRFFLKEQSYRQIAQELNIQEKKVKSHIQNGKRNLKICIEQSEK